MTLVGRPNAVLKSKPIQPGPRFFGSATGRLCRTGPGIADRHHVVGPPIGKLPDAGDHLLSRHFWTGSELPLVALAGREDFDVGATHVDDQHVHEMPRRRRACRCEPGVLGEHALGNAMR